MKKIEINLEKIINIIILGILALFFTMQNVNFPCSQNYTYSDSSVYQYIGKLITEGEMPYLDAFDHKGPILYCINAIGYLINKDWGIWFIDFVVMFFILYFSWKIIKQFLNDKLAIFIVSVIMSGITWSYWIGNTPEFYSLLFLTIIIDRLMKFFLDKEVTKIDISLVGVLTSSIFLIKPNLIIPIVVICCFIIFYSLCEKNYTFVWRCIGYFCIGFFGVLLIVVAWLLQGNAFEAFIDNYFLFNISYADSDSTGLKIIEALIFFSSQKIVFAAIAGLGLCFYRIKAILKYKKLILVMFCSAIVSLLLIIMPGRSYVQYFLILYPYLLFFVAMGLKTLQTKSVGIGICLLTMFIFVLVPNMETTFSKQKSYLSVSSVRKEVLEYVIKNTEENDKIAVFTPDDCGIYLEANRKSATTYPYVQALILSGKYGEKYLEEYYKQILEEMPKLIICRKWSADKSMKDLWGLYENVWSNDTFIVYRLVSLGDNNLPKVIENGTYLLYAGNRTLKLLETEDTLTTLEVLDKDKVSLETDVQIITYQGITKIYFKDSRKYLTSDKINNTITIEKSTGQTNQVWQIKSLEEGYFVIVDNNGNALTYDFLDGTVYLRSFTNSINQKWKICKKSNENERFVIENTTNYFIEESLLTAEEYQKVKKLHSIINIDEYLEFLKNLDGISVYFSVKDIQGYVLTESTINKLEQLGFEQANILLEHEYHNFVGIYSNGRVIYEHIGGDEKFEYERKVKNYDVLIESSTLHTGNSSKIIIEGIDYSVKYRGINIVVMDNTTGKIMDAVTFDTHQKGIPCVR